MKKPSIGGQAVIEGVLMRTNKKLAIAVRKKNSIILKKHVLRKRHKILKLPFIRGMSNLIDILITGTKALTWSAHQQSEGGEKITKREIVLSLLFSILIVVLFFIALPYLLTWVLGFKEETMPFFFNLVDGVIKLLLFLLYIMAISFMGEVRKLFQYHGAEHMAVACYENNEKLTIENCKKYSTLHPRCGTAFLMIVFFISVLLFSLLPVFLIYVQPSFQYHGFWLRRTELFTLRLLIIPIIAGIAYEILKLSDRYKDNPIVNAAIKPGLWLQKMTTKAPTEKQIEVAIKALREVL